MTTSPQLHNQPGDRLQVKIDASHQFWVWLAFSLAAVVTIGLFFVPAFIIRPFTYQAPRALYVAMALRQRAPIGTLIAALVCLALALSLWKSSTLLRKSLLTLVMVLVAFSAAMSRLNYFEWMFHPIDSAQFLAQSESKLDSKEMIMAVRFSSDARAYPISQMAYHHVLNDTVAGTPIVVTY
jgi:Protein of unknown function (DUF3179)